MSIEIYYDFSRQRQSLGSSVMEQGLLKKGKKKTKKTKQSAQRKPRSHSSSAMSSKSLKAHFSCRDLVWVSPEIFDGSVLGPYSQ